MTPDFEPPIYSEDDKPEFTSWKSKATLIEVFDDCDGAVTRVQNLMSSEIAAEWMERFVIETLTVLGDANDALADALASMRPDIRTYAGGFTR